MRKLIYVGKFFVAISALWAIGASLYILLAPISGQGVTLRRNFGEQRSVVETFTTEQSWYEAQGLWGVVVLVIFAGLYLLAVHFAWRSSYIALTVLSVIAIALSIVTGFSIGGLYFPAAVGLFIGAMIFLCYRLIGSR